MSTLLQKFGVAALVAAASLMNTHLASAQHSDVEFEYDGGKIAIEFGSEGRVFESEFPTTDPLEQFTDDPGFASEFDEGLGVNPGDVIDYKILGPLEYHDGSSFAAVPAGAQILIEDNPTGDLTVTSATVGPVTGGGVIGVADGIGDVHTHIDFTLQPGEFDTGDNPPAGAYSLLMRLTTDATGIANSDPFYIVFNFGLEEEVFEGAVEAFAAKVPEPSSLALLGTGVVVLGMARRRRESLQQPE